MTTQVATLGGGCFWCLEAALLQLKGVESVVSGYAGGATDQPDYHAICSGRTGHAEVVEVRFDPAVIDYRTLLTAFFAIHDPTTLNRQGNDIGTQYRSGIYTYGEEQQQAAERSRALFQAALQRAGHGAVTTEIVAAPEFYYAEDYHQQYLAKNPGGYCGLGGTGVSCPIGLSGAGT